MARKTIGIIEDDGASTAREDKLLAEAKAKKQEELNATHQTMTIKINNFIHSYEKKTNNGERRFDYIASAYNFETKKSISIILNNSPELDKLSTYKVTVESIGEYNNQPQYTIGSCVQVIRPDDLNGLEKWLSRFCNGVGENIAKAIIRELGKSAHVALSNPEVLKGLNCLNDKLAEEISKTWNADKNKNELYAYLIKFRNSETGRSIFNKRQIQNMIETYGIAIKEVIKQNPWSLIKMVSNLGFQTADAIARASGADMNSPDRLNAAIAFSMKKIEKDKGHCYAKIDDLVFAVNKNTGIDKDIVQNHLEVESDETKKDLENADDEWYIVENSKVYRTEIYKAELKIVNKITRMLERGPRCTKEFAENLVNKVAKTEGLVLDKSQHDAAVTSLLYPVVVMTGGPGVGKSTIQKIIMNCLIEMNKTFSASCPTGKGARRQEEASGFPATTVHRQLEYSPEEEGFRKNASNPIDADAIIVDEASMEDILIASKQIDAVKDDAQIIYVGDVNQIPSVDAGQFLKDMIMSGLIPVCVLSKTHRQANESGIPLVAQRILEGEYPIQPGEKLRGVNIIEIDNDENLSERTAQYIKYELPKMGLSPDKDLMVLAPTKESADGVFNLNSLIKHSINNHNDKETHPYPGDKIFTTRDVVMQMKNDKDLKVNNGESGRIVGFQTVIVEKDVRGKSVKLQEELPVVDFDGRRVVYSIDALENLVPANAGTYHKAQGSEQVCAIIVCPSDDSSRRMNTRNLLYTGFTRAKGDAVIIGTRESIMKAVLNMGVDRQTGLRERLNNKIGYIKQLWNNHDWDTSFLDHNAEIIAHRESEEKRIKDKIYGRSKNNSSSTFVKKTMARKPRMISKVTPVTNNGEKPEIESIQTVKEEPIPVIEKKNELEIKEDVKLNQIPEKHNITPAKDKPELEQAIEETIQEENKVTPKKPPARRPKMTPRFL